MATAADDSTPYGGGAGGKLRKTHYRRPQTTPYDRPPTTLRSLQRNNINGGWISRIVDPASKLISATAHKLFSSVSRKRFLPTPDEKVQLSENHLRDVITEDPSRIRDRDMNQGKAQVNDSAIDEDVQLEHILKKKTFTRSEIDRLTTLLHSRTVDKTGISVEGGFERAKPSELSAGNSSRKDIDGTIHEKRFHPFKVPETYLTPSVRSKVSDDVFSPAELAKAYMGSRSTKVSLSRLGPRNHAARQETPSHSSFQLQRPTMTTVQKPLSTAGTSQNDFVTPRSPGGSAIYNMARTPYYRASGTSNDACHVTHGQSFSSQKGLKRRSSVLENDIGFVGPIRRIRQISNLLYPKTLRLSSSHTPLPHATSSKVGEASLYSSSKSQEGGGDQSLSVSNSHVSSKSIEMGERILQQLEKLTPPREKSSEKESGAFGGMSAMELTPSIPHGQAHKSFEAGCSLAFLQSDQVNCKIVDPHAAALCEMRDSTPRKRDNVHDSTSKVLMNSSYKVYPENDKAEISNNDIRGVSKATGPMILKPADDVATKSRAFQISSHEFFLELEASPMQTSSQMLLENPPLPEAAKVDKPDFLEIQPSLNSLLRRNIAVNSTTSADNGISQSFATDNVSKKRNDFSAPSCQPAVGSQTYLSDKADDSPATISSGLNKSDKTTPVSFFPPSVVESSTPKDVKSQCPSSVLAFASDATDATLKLPGANCESAEAVNMFKQSDNPPLSSLPGSAISSVSFKLPAKTSTGNMNSLGSCPATSAAPPPVVFSSQSSSSGSSAQSTFAALTTTAINAGDSAKKVGGDANGSVVAAVNVSSSNSVSSAALTSFQSGPKFGISMDSDSVKETCGTETVSNSTETGLGRVTSSNLSAAAPASTHRQSQASDNVSGLVFGQQVFPSTTVASTVQSMPIQPAPFSLSSASLMASSGSTGSANTSIFCGSWQPSNSPVFGSTINNSSSGFNFGASSASTPSSGASSGFVFGVSAPANGSLASVPFGASSGSASATATATATPASVFQFGSAASSQPIYGNGSCVFAFGSTTSPSAMGNNDEMSMDTMVEDAMQSSAPTIPPPTFGQSPTTNFGFGMVGPNPFQLGMQQNQLTANQNPFQASGSFDGGSFSLGAGGNDKSKRRIVNVRKRINK